MNSSLQNGVLVSMVVPVYRSASSLRELVERIALTMEKAEWSWELIFVDDASPDDSWDTLRELAVEYPQILCIQLMRNFGQHNALMCGFEYASGDVIVTLDDDLQHAPEDVASLVSRLQESGADLVYGVYDTKRHSLSRNLGSWLIGRFYRLIFHLPVKITSFRALRRDLVRSILRYDLNFTYVDGLLAWNTQRISMVTVPHHARIHGASGYTVGKLLSLAMNVFTNFSLLPLRVVSCVGIVAAFGGLALGSWYLVSALLAKIDVPGYASIIVAVLVLGGLQLLSLGIIGEYLGRLHMNVNRKPQYTIRSRISSRDAAIEDQKRSEPIDGWSTNSAELLESRRR